MRRLVRLARLRADERRVLVKTAILMPAFRLGLWIFPFRRLMAFTAHCAVALPRGGNSDAERIGWAVQVVRRYVPKATCLVQALTAKVLLENAGFPANLQIGVMKDERFEAHAWVVSLGKVVTGGAELERYSPLLPWGK
jgi:hypothetical protein